MIQEEALNFVGASILSPDTYRLYSARIISRTWLELGTFRFHQGKQLEKDTRQFQIINTTKLN